MRQLLSRVARLFVIVLFLIMALQNLGVELLPLIAGLGVAGAGIALATQGVLSNMVAGLTIIFTKPYRVGEYISIVGVEGQVEAITLFNTALTHADQSRVIVPNRKVVGEILHNYGRIRQAEIRVGIAYESDVALALAVIGDLVRANPHVLTQPKPLVQVAALADSAVQIRGALGVSEDTPVSMILRMLRPFRIYDGASEVHRSAIAKRALRHGLTP